MATNYHSDGHTIDYTNGGGSVIKSGAPVAIGALLAIALNDIAPGETGAASIDGCWTLPKASGALAQGQAVDFDVSASKVAALGTPAAGDLVGCGIVVAAAGASAGSVTIKVNVSGATVTA